jgi:hypothetical protein
MMYVSVNAKAVSLNLQAVSLNLQRYTAVPPAMLDGAYGTAAAGLALFTKRFVSVKTTPGTVHVTNLTPPGSDDHTRRRRRRSGAAAR